ncbi:MAG: 23S rRNA (adenine(2503)-C(2))-methyltransferase RlmN [candidate division WOR-3 bacterium]|jgi:23S rRNA (adenine2503-C2)-methyltransferase|nr:23S rRNA (adenine(2503)-C(2))-methyltransferase RlmN [candidate division WOR-3 bacterium]MCR4423085.1 23S rRNA (adenine(2503)-C(2))-methyltransferase RlmN [candidate division WOR-3 bacterium]MDH7518424.1 23S rRNA (adenine(2503)-C(2))-methyltransferase RlmN [bacterium]
MTDIKSFTLEQLIQYGEKCGWEKYRARQLFLWLYQKNATSFDEMTNLSKNFRQELSKQFYISNLSPIRILSSPDSTVKLTFALQDDNIIESVLLFDQNRRTVCVSTQVGCPLNCRICATAKLGFKRNLKWFEIVEQIQALIRQTNTTPTNIVFMGMGEPLLNLDEVLEAVKTINSDYGLKIGARRITISTAGIPDGIYRLAQFPLQIRLAVSLNATNDQTRSMIMPINKRYPLKILFEAIRAYYAQTHRRITFEYVLLDGINNLPEDISRLVRLLEGIPCKINLIPFNPFPGSPFRPPTPAAVKRFALALYPHLPTVTIRKSKGGKILAGCGQLAGELNIP